MSPDNGQELSEPISGSYADYLESEQVGSRIDQPRIRAAVREILLAIGEDPDRSGLKGAFLTQTGVSYPARREVTVS